MLETAETRVLTGFAALVYREGDEFPSAGEIFVPLYRGMAETRVLTGFAPLRGVTTLLMTLRGFGGA
jgi:hypothetical protein